MAGQYTDEDLGKLQASGMISPQTRQRISGFNRQDADIMAVRDIDQRVGFNRLQGFEALSASTRNILQKRRPQMLEQAQAQNQQPMQRPPREQGPQAPAQQQAPQGQGAPEYGGRNPIIPFSEMPFSIRDSWGVKRDEHGQVMRDKAGNLLKDDTELPEHIDLREYPLNVQRNMIRAHEQGKWETTQQEQSRQRAGESRKKSPERQAMYEKTQARRAQELKWAEEDAAKKDSNGA